MIKNRIEPGLSELAFSFPRQVIPENSAAGVQKIRRFPFDESLFGMGNGLVLQTIPAYISGQDTRPVDRPIICTIQYGAVGC